MKNANHRLALLTNEQGDGQARVLAHLRQLSADDLALRFGLARVKDETLVSYVRSLNFERDIVVAMQDSEGSIVALAHAARYEVQRSAEREARAEVSLSVVPAHRGCGLAGLLMQAIIDAAAEAEIHCLVAQCVGANRPMRAAFARSGWTMEVDSGEVFATLPVLRHSAFNPAVTALPL